MLEKISYSDLPVVARSKSKNVSFAETCVDEFARLTCDAVKVSGWPLPRDTKSLVTTMRKAIKTKNMTHKIKAHADQEYVYLSRTR